MGAARSIKAAEPITVMVSVREAARASALSEVHMRRLIKAGSVRAVRIGRAVRVPVSELRRLAGE